jgi:hypothetical protein
MCGVGVNRLAPWEVDVSVTFRGERESSSALDRNHYARALGNGKKRRALERLELAHNVAAEKQRCGSGKSVAACISCQPGSASVVDAFETLTERIGFGSLQNRDQRAWSGVLKAPVVEAERRGKNTSRDR